MFIKIKRTFLKLNSELKLKFVSHYTSIVLLEFVCAHLQMRENGIRSTWSRGNNFNRPETCKIKRFNF